MTIHNVRSTDWHSKLSLPHAVYNRKLSKTTNKKPSCCWDSRSYCVGNFDRLKLYINNITWSSCASREHVFLLGVGRMGA